DSQSRKQFPILPSIKRWFAGFFNVRLSSWTQQLVLPAPIAGVVKLFVFRTVHSADLRMPVEPTVMQISCHGGVLSTLSPCSLLPCCTSGISGCSKVPVQMRGLSGNQQQSRLGFSAGICFTPRFLSVRPVGQVSQRLPSSAAGLHHADRLTVADQSRSSGWTRYSPRLQAAPRQGSPGKSG